jgi:hypothetical protein
METTPRVLPQEFADSMKEEVEEYLKKVMEAVNSAADGAWIAGSEEQVRDLSAEMRRRVFEAAVQKRTDAAEAAFPPSARSNHRQAAGQ